MIYIKSDEYNIIQFSLCIFMAIFQVNLGQSVFIEAKDDEAGGKNWSYKTYNVPVKLSPPPNHHQTV